MNNMRAWPSVRDLRKQMCNRALTSTKTWSKLSLDAALGISYTDLGNWLSNQVRKPGTPIRAEVLDMVGFVVGQVLMEEGTVGGGEDNGGFEDNFGIYAEEGEGKILDG